ncbi:HEAT repeat domain-containing protein [bacterium]|nr:HEAT repeat domain-containing protein [bacterium]
MTEESSRLFRVILEGLNSRDRGQKLYSLRAVGVLGFSEHSDLLVDLLASPDEEIVGKTIEVLGILANPSSFKHLKGFVTGGNQALSEKALSAISHFDLRSVLDEVLMLAGPELPVPLRCRLFSILSNLNEPKIAAIMGEVLYQTPGTELLTAAIGYFTRFPSKAQYNILKSLASHGVIEIALGAHIALTRLSEEPSRQQLRRLLKSPSANIRLTIVKGLNKAPLAEDKEFFDVFFKDSHSEIRLAALDGLILFNAQERALIIAEWIKREKDESVRSKLLSIATKEGNHGLYEVFLNLLGSPSEEMKRMSRLAISKMGVRIVDRILSDFPKLSLVIREQLVIVLGRIGGEKIIPIFNSCLRSPQRWLRLNTIEALANLGAKSYVPLFLETLKKEEDIWVRATLISAISKLGDQTHIKVISDNLKHSDARVRANSIEGLLRLGGEEAKKIIEPYLRDPSDRVRVNSAMALWKMGDVSVTGTLIGMLKEPTKWIKASSAYALGEMQCSKAVPELLQLLASQEDVVYKNVVEALGKIADSQAIIPLLKEHESGRVSEELMNRVLQRFSVKSRV